MAVDTLYLPFCFLILFFAHAVVCEQFCFRKVELEGYSRETAAGTTLCRGHISHRSFRSQRGCCKKGGKGYYSELIKKGRRGKKYVCIPCPSVTGSATTAPPRSTTSLDLFVISGVGWTQWGEYSDCSLTCGIGLRIRRRICESGRNQCDGEAVERRSCTLSPECPIDGKFGPWRVWSECSATCNGGVRNRDRPCNNPPPSKGGKDCRGDTTQTESCNTQACPVDGNWSDWSEPGECSVTCGKGVRQRNRTCTNPEPAGGGKICVGPSTDKIKCELAKCPIDGGWALWKTWSSCGITCGQSVRFRERKCAAPVPRHNGSDCVGESNERQMCYSPRPCPVNGGWSLWGLWGPCLATPCMGERGLQKRTRTCTNPQPQFNGSLCMGNSTEVQNCFNNVGCKVDGSWCEWSAYDECHISDTGKFRRRIRTCGCPLPENGGIHCPGQDFQVEQCNNNLEAIRDSIVPSPKTESKCTGNEGSGGIWDDEDC